MNAHFGILEADEKSVEAISCGVDGAYALEPCDDTMEDVFSDKVDVSVCGREDVSVCGRVEGGGCRWGRMVAVVVVCMLLPHFEQLEVVAPCCDEIADDPAVGGSVMEAAWSEACADGMRYPRRRCSLFVDGVHGGVSSHYDINITGQCALSHVTGMDSPQP